jgi:ketosteroid isomerase-like protein
VASAREVVERYFDAWAGKDFAAQRSTLHDDLHFQGPFDTFDQADGLMAALERLAPIVEGVDIEHWLVAGDETVVLYTLRTSIPNGTVPCAEWSQVREGKIAKIRVYFDARPFAAMFHATDGEQTKQ